MAYHKHHTQGIILGGFASGEGDRLLYIFTREFGLICAFARSVRTERSKLRPSLQEYTIGTVSLIRGKEFWRIASMSRSASFYHALKTRKDALRSLIRLSEFLKRVFPGEEKNEEAYDVFASGISALTYRDRDGADFAMIETLTSARLLALLGHLPKKPYTELLSGKEFAPMTLSSMKQHHSPMAEAVKYALQESGL